MFGESFKFFGPSPPQNDGPLNFFAKLNANHILMVNFSKLRKYQTFGFIELHNLSKGQLADGIFKLWKSSVYNYPADLRLRLSDFLSFATFKQLLSKILWKTFQVSKYILKVLIKFYHFTNISVLKFLENETTVLWHFLKFARNSLLLLKFCQMREILKPQFCWCL